MYLAKISNEISKAQNSKCLITNYQEILTALDEGKLEKIIIKSSSNEELNQDLDDMIEKAYYLNLDIQLINVTDKEQSEVIAISHYH